MTNALRHMHSRSPGLINIALMPVVIPAGTLVFHTNWSDSDGNYGGPVISKTGAQLWIDFGDGTIDRLTGSNTHSYLDGSTKTIQIWPSDDWSGVTTLYTNWSHCVGSLPDPSLMPNITDYVCDNNQYDGSIPDFSACTALQNLHLEGNLLSGALPSFAALIALLQLNLNSNNGLSGTLPSFAACMALQYLLMEDTAFSGTLPSFNTCTNLISFRANNAHFSGTLPSFAACTAMTEFLIPNNSLTDYTSGCLSTQPNLANIFLNDNQFPQAAIDAILANLVTSLGVGGRVICYVALNGGSNAHPSTTGMASRATLLAAGWTVDIN